jgi:hypothetical protein
MQTFFWFSLRFHQKEKEEKNARVNRYDLALVGHYLKTRMYVIVIKLENLIIAKKKRSYGLKY